MELGQLEAFLAVVQKGSFTKAAEHLNLTQPSLSARIYQLEQNLQGALFLRTKRPVQLTPLGEVLVSYAERGLSILKAGQEAVRSAQLGITGKITVCCPFSQSTYLIPQVVSQFSQEYPLAELYIETGHSDFAIRQLLDGIVNLAVAAAFPRFLTQTRPLLRLHDEMVVAANSDHALASSQNISLAQLWQYQLLVIHWGTAFTAYFDSLYQTRTGTESVLRIPLAVALPMMRQSNRIIFAPRRLAISTGLVPLDVPEFRFDWDTILVTRPNRNLTALEQAFVDLVATVWFSNQPLGI